MCGGGGGGAGRVTRTSAQCCALSDEEVGLYTRPFLPVEPVESSSGRPAAHFRTCGSVRGDSAGAKQQDAAVSGGVSVRGGSRTAPGT